MFLKICGNVSLQGMGRLWVVFFHTKSDSTGAHPIALQCSMLYHSNNSVQAHRVLPPAKLFSFLDFYFLTCLPTTRLSVHIRFYFSPHDILISR